MSLLPYKLFYINIDSSGDFLPISQLFGKEKQMELLPKIAQESNMSFPQSVLFYGCSSAKMALF